MSGKNALYTAAIAAVVVVVLNKVKGGSGLRVGI